MKIIKNIVLLFIIIIGLFILAGCQELTQSNNDNNTQQSEIDRLTAENERLREILAESERPDEPDEYITENTPNTLAQQQLSEIPYFGDINLLNMSSEQAMEYAGAVERATYNRFEGDNYDRIIPMLIDVSNDGIPLLMIIPNGEARPAAPPADSFYLLGFNNGRVQEICRTRNITVVKVDNENLLCAYIDGAEIDWNYGKFSLYRVNNGTTELISELDFESFHDDMGEEPSIYYVNGENVNEDIYNQAVGEYRLLLSNGVHFIREHHGWNFFDESDLPYAYWGNPFSREHVKQAFINYADAMNQS
jgi:hypothetical protein